MPSKCSQRLIYSCLLCIVKIRVETKSFAEERSLKSAFWTSGSSKSCPGQYMWCGTQELVNEASLISRRSGDIVSWKQCLVISFAGTTESYRDFDCINEKKEFICEVCFLFLKILTCPEMSVL